MLTNAAEWKYGFLHSFVQVMPYFLILIIGLNIARLGGIDKLFSAIETKIWNILYSISGIWAVYIDEASNWGRYYDPETVHRTHFLFYFLSSISATLLVLLLWLITTALVFLFRFTIMIPFRSLGASNSLRYVK